MKSKIHLAEIAFVTFSLLLHVSYSAQDARFSRYNDLAPSSISPLENADIINPTLGFDIGQEKEKAEADIIERPKKVDAEVGHKKGDSVEADDITTLPKAEMTRSHHSKYHGGKEEELGIDVADSNDGESLVEENEQEDLPVGKDTDTDDEDDNQSDVSENEIQSQAKAPDLMGKLYRLISTGQQADKSVARELLIKQKKNEAELHALAAQRQRIEHDAKMLRRLQECLDHGSVAEQAQTKYQKIKKDMAQFETEKENFEKEKEHTKKLQAELQEKERSLLTLQTSIKNQQEEAHKKEEEHKSQFSLLSVKENQIQQKEAALKQKEQELSQRLSEIETQALRFKQHPPLFTSTMGPRNNSDCQPFSGACDECIRNEGCGWCNSRPGQCLAQNVNAQEGGPIQDGLVSGACSIDKWSAGVTSRLTLLSLNIFGDDVTNSTARAANIIALIGKLNPDIVTFQEAKSWFKKQIIEDVGIISKYKITDYGRDHVPGGLLILSKMSLFSVSYYEQVHPGQLQIDQRGRVLLIQTPINGNTITVATTCLDWRDSTVRTGSLDFIFSTLAPFKDVFLTGDFNFDDGAIPESQHLPWDYIDVWPTVHTNRHSEPGDTWDPDRNLYARNSDPKSQPSRIDRVFIRSSHWMPRSIRLVGCGKNDLLCDQLTSSTGTTISESDGSNLVSNHYGLFMEVSRFDPHC